MIEKVNRTDSKVASVFSSTLLRALSRADLATTTAAKLGLAASFVEDQPNATVADALDAAHAHLSRAYRGEYVFKNELVSRIIFGRHSPKIATAALEIRMGDSCADLLVANGTSTVYEIKTDLDSFGRLDSQLENYSSRAEFVYVVTSVPRVEAAARRTPANVGVIGLRNNGSLHTHRNAQSNAARLSSLHLFEMLREEEATASLKRLAGWTPPTNQAIAWVERRAAFAALDPECAHSEVVRHLRGRAASARHLVADPFFPASLRALAYTEEHSRVGAARIRERLRHKAALFLGLDGR